MDWTDAIKLRLKLDGISQDALAERMGVSQGAINHWLSGRRNADYVTVARMVEVLGMDMADLATRRPANLTRLTPPPDPLLTELLAHAGRMNRAGLARLVERAASLAEQYPAQANPAKSSG